MAGRRVPKRPSANLTKEQRSIILKGSADTMEWLGLAGAPDKALKAANNEAARIVSQSAKVTANFKYSKPGTGRLLRSIRTASTVNRAIVRAGNKSVPYAGVIHWGWYYDRNYFIYKNIEPNPFLSKALGYNREEILRTYKEQVDKLLAEYKPPRPR
jgi:phage gpG-like protein